MTQRFSFTIQPDEREEDVKVMEDDVNAFLDGKRYLEGLTRRLLTAAGWKEPQVEGRPISQFHIDTFTRQMHHSVRILEVLRGVGLPREGRGSTTDGDKNGFPTPHLLLARLILAFNSKHYYFQDVEDFYLSYLDDLKKKDPSFVKGFDVNMNCWFHNKYQSLLFLAASVNNLDAMKFLLNTLHANPSVSDKHPDNTIINQLYVMHQMSHERSYTEEIELLVSHGGTIPFPSDKAFLRRKTCFWAKFATKYQWKAHTGAKMSDLFILFTDMYVTGMSEKEYFTYRYGGVAPCSRTFIGGIKKRTEKTKTRLTTVLLETTTFPAELCSLTSSYVTHGFLDILTGPVRPFQDLKKKKKEKKTLKRKRVPISN